jgi:hypothetical protein
MAPAGTGELVAILKRPIGIPVFLAQTHQPQHYCLVQGTLLFDWSGHRWRGGVSLSPLLICLMCSLIDLRVRSDFSLVLSSRFLHGDRRWRKIIVMSCYFCHYSVQQVITIYIQTFSTVFKDNWIKITCAFGFLSINPELDLTVCPRPKSTTGSLIRMIIHYESLMQFSSHENKTGALYWDAFDQL